MIKARPTTYKGIQMRSRLEAAWAAHFDKHGWTWEYEPMCFADESGQYLPDFAVRTSPDMNPTYVEIKPPLPDDTIRTVARRMSIIWHSEPTVELLICTGDYTVYGNTFTTHPGAQLWEKFRDDGLRLWEWLIGVQEVAHSHGHVAQLADGSFFITRRGAGGWAG